MNSPRSRITCPGCSWSPVRLHPCPRDHLGGPGAGEIQPSLSDLITVGGVVSPERFQFLVWTILGIVSFIFLIVAQSPAQFQEIPRIPDGFLQLMGVSSAGYLGGKLVRKPGPVIDTILAQAQPQGQSLTLEVIGRCLSRNASFQIDDADVTLALLGAVAQAAAHCRGTPSWSWSVMTTPRRNPTAYAAELRLTLSDRKAWLMSHGKSPDAWTHRRRRPLRLRLRAGSGPRAPRPSTSRASEAPSHHHQPRWPEGGLVIRGSGGLRPGRKAWDGSTKLRNYLNTTTRPEAHTVGDTTRAHKPVG